MQSPWHLVGGLGLLGVEPEKIPPGRSPQLHSGRYFIPVLIFYLSRLPFSQPLRERAGEPHWAGSVGAHETHIVEEEFTLEHVIAFKADF